MRGLKLRNVDELTSWSVGLATQPGTGTVKALLDSKAPSTDPTFTGTVTGITSSMVTFTPTSGISSTNLQGALAELAGDRVAVTGTTGSAVLPTGSTAARDTLPAAGYIRFNTDLSQYEGYTGSAWVSISGSSGGSGSGSVATSKVTRSGITLGSFPANQADFTYVTISSIAARGLMSQLIVSASLVGVFDLVVRGTANDTGSLWLQALSVATSSYSVSLPIYVENDAGGQDFFIGIRNRGNSAVTVTLNNLRIERFE